MPKFRVSATVVGSKYIGEFEAETAEEAEVMAWQSGNAHVSMCHECTDECEDPECSEMHVAAVTDD